jgi:disulfide bond formation protein DsbB
LDLMLDSRRPWWLQPRTLNFAGFLWCAALMAYALYAQYVLHDDPCPLCVLQRVAVIGVGLVFLLAAVVNPASRAMRRGFGAAVVIVALIGIAIAARHIYILNAPAGSVAECGASLDYMMDVLPMHEVLAKVLTGSGECAKLDWQFLGLNMPTWVLMSLVAVGTWGLAVNWFARKGVRG